MLFIMKRSLFILGLFICTVGILHADEYDSMRQRLVDHIALGTNFSTTDPDVVTYVASLDNQTRTAWNSMIKTPTTYLWSSYNKLIGDKDNTPSHVWYTYNNLRYMAKSWACPASAFYHNNDLLADIKMGLDFMNAYAFNSSTSAIGNFYEWRIGIPEYYGHIVALLYDSIGTMRIANYSSSVAHMVHNTAVNGNLTYANQANVCQELITLGILTKDSAMIQAALQSGVKVFVDNTSVQQRLAAQSAFAACWLAQGDYHKYAVGAKEGLYPDGTFIQHIAIPYIGAYGLEIIEYAAFMGIVLKNTQFSIPESVIDILPTWIEQTYLPAIYKGEMLQMFMGRSANKNPFENGYKTILHIYSATKTTLSTHPAYERIMVACRQQISSPASYTTALGGLSPLLDKPLLDSITSYSSTNTDSTFSKVYPCGDRVIHQTARFRFGLSMSSSRIGKFESINNANTKGWYQGDGMTYLYLPSDRQHYVGYYGTNLNWYRLPGTTVDVTKRAEETHNYGLFGIPSHAKDWTGGVSLHNRFSVAGMYLVGQKSSLEAKKSWFMFDDEVVCLGAGITLTDNQRVESIIEQRKSTSEITIDGIARAKKKGTDLPFVNPQYLHLEGTGGYYFPDSVTIHTFVSYDGYSLFYFDHGTAPINSTYSYVLLPGMSKEQTAAYADTPKVQILANTPMVQAVCQKEQNVVGINFWEAAKVSGVRADGAASVLLQQREDTLYISVSDPTWKRATQVITLDGAFQLSGDQPDELMSIVNNGDSITRLNIRTENRMGQSSTLVLLGQLTTSGLHQESTTLASKYFRNGQVLIQKNGRNYTILGVPIEDK